MKNIDKRIITELNKSFDGNKFDVDYCIKNYKYVVVDDVIIEIGRLKPFIEKTMDYDDTEQAPVITEQMFIEYNMLLHIEKPLLPDDVTKYILRNNYYRGDILEISPLNGNAEDGIMLTSKIIEAINQARGEIEQDYIKRLKNYYKRYKKYICI